MKVSVIALTWNRLNGLGATLLKLSNQTYKDFDVHISNGNLKKTNTVDKYCNAFKDKLNISVYHEGNDNFAFRRMTLARDLAKSGSDIILFIDDDVDFPENYIENCISQYEPNTYKSCYAWYFTSNVDYYMGRHRVKTNDKPVHYAGTGLGMVDAKIFLEDGLFDVPECAYQVEDLWLSYYADHVMGWSLGWIENSNTTVGGRDKVALSRTVRVAGCNKNDFFSELTINYGWKPAITVG